uniref:Ribosomal protein S7 n=1 Tax=Malawimonas jakobiformis TaxID=136089 RepID=Q9G879_MALJA|nr:ribosomal protein S7 [Malawimonas jakobiformis]AAG13694.1 ribosomal protein S7 [Malawimonas jakobiformis]
MKLLKQEYKDPLFKDPIISKLINVLMKKGNKSKIEKIVYKSLELIKKNTKKTPLTIIKKAISNIKPSVELKSIKIAAKSYQIPFEISLKRQQNLAIRWLVESVNNRSEKELTNRLYLEILNAYQQKGNAFKKKDDIHHKAESNRSFIHYRW